MEDLQRAMTLEEWRAYYSRFEGHDRYLYALPNGMNLTQFTAGEAFSIYLEALARYPDIVIKDRLDGMNLLWDVTQPDESYNTDYSDHAFIESDIGLLVPGAEEGEAYRNPSLIARAYRWAASFTFPGEALTEAQKYGTLELAKIENMRTQAQQLAAGGKAQSTDDLEAIEQELEAAEHENAGEAEPEKDFGFLAVCAGKGLANVFTDLGADGVISGGQTMNPSTESILKEIKKVPAHTVFVLPNNKNIIMAAQQCIGLTEKTVVVIPTASIPQGVSAMMAVDPDMSDADAIAKAMTDAAQCVSTAQITYAARNSDFDGFDIHEGDYLALLDGKLLGTDRDVSALLDGLSDEAASREAEFITVFYGEDVNEEDAHKACDAFTRKCPDAEVNLICGGQPVYYYIISIE